MLIKRSTKALFFCIFQLLLKYSESIETFKKLPGENILLIESDTNATNVDEAKTQCASRDAILIPLGQDVFKFFLIVTFKQNKGKLMKSAFCAKKIDIFIKRDIFFVTKGAVKKINSKNRSRKKRLACWLKQKYFFLNSKKLHRILKIIK